MLLRVCSAAAPLNLLPHSDTHVDRYSAKGPMTNPWDDTQSLRKRISSPYRSLRLPDYLASLIVNTRATTPDLNPVQAGSLPTFLVTPLQPCAAATVD